GGVGKALGPHEGFLARLDVDDGVAGDELLRLGERAVDEAARAVPAVADAPARPARLEAGAVDEDAGLRHFLVERAHLGEQPLGRHPAGLRVRRRLDEDDEPHEALLALRSRASAWRAKRSRIACQPSRCCSIECVPSASNVSRTTTSPGSSTNSTLTWRSSPSRYSMSRWGTMRV